ncbi:MAG: hypothetical protein WCF90_09860, partial [Methanomicrobiales archaeon]
GSAGGVLLPAVITEMVDNWMGDALEFPRYEDYESSLFQGPSGARGASFWVAAHFLPAGMGASAPIIILITRDG